MACIKAPLLPPVSLPAGISLALPSVGIAVDIDINFCCHINIPLNLSLNLPTLTITADLLAPINALFLLVDTYLDKLQISCPFE